MQEGFFKKAAREVSERGSDSSDADKSQSNQPEAATRRVKVRPKLFYHVVIPHEYQPVNEIKPITNVAEESQDGAIHNPAPPACPGQQRQPDQSQEQEMRRRQHQHRTQNSPPR